MSMREASRNLGLFTRLSAAVRQLELHFCLIYSDWQFDYQEKRI